jgi:hydroxypyruvate reductase
MSSVVPNPRALLAALYDAAVQGAAPFPCTRDAVVRWCAAHQVGAGARVHVIATGKASPAMTAGALDALSATGALIVGGVVVAAHDPGPADWFGVRRPTSLRVLRGDHPVPGAASLDAADAIDDALLAVEPGDLALVLISGGTTALCAAPIASLAQRVGDADRAQAVVAQLASTLLASGLAIHEMNAIRRRLLRFGAGRLAVQLAHRGAAQIGAFAISDVIGDDPSVIGSGPCSPDPFDDATFLALIDAHGLREQLSRDEAEALGLLGTSVPPSVPAPTHHAFTRVQFEVVSGNRAATAAMARAATTSGIETVLVDEQPIEGEADAVGLALAQRALALAPALPKGHHALLVSGGEPVVHLAALEHAALERAYEAQQSADALDDDAPLDERRDIVASVADPMRGGRMQVVALAAALQLEAATAKGDPFGWQITVLAAGTDGRDGPTDAAGAIVDAAVPALARRHGRSPDDDLLNGRSWYALEAAEALLKPGPTGTNVMDVVGVLIRG